MHQKDLMKLPNCQDQFTTSSRRESVYTEEADTWSIAYVNEKKWNPSSTTEAVQNGTEKDPMESYPEGGTRAWLVVIGSWCSMFACFSLMNTTGTYQSYISTHQLAGYEESTIGWIFSLYIFLSFVCGIQIGPCFDAQGPRFLIAAGSVSFLLGVFSIAESTKLWHFFITYSLLAGVGTSLLFTPAIACIAHYFNNRRGFATGLAATAGSIGGTIFPLVLPTLFDKVGFAWATRIMGFVQLVALIFANLLLKSRLPAKSEPKVEDFLPDFRILKKGRGELALCAAGIFAIEWGLFIPLTYVTSWALERDVGTATFGYQLLAILNAGSFFGRWLPGLFADRVGPFNTIIGACIVCLTTILAFWLTDTVPPHSLGDDAAQRNSVALAVTFCLLFGFGSGSGISLTPVCVGRLCAVEHYGRYYATAYTIVSVGCLTGVPIAGALVQACDGEYTGLVAFVAACYALGLACFAAARILLVGWRPSSFC